MTENLKTAIDKALLSETLDQVVRDRDELLTLLEEMTDSAATSWPQAASDDDITKARAVITRIRASQ